MRAAATIALSAATIVVPACGGVIETADAAADAGAMEAAVVSCSADDKCADPETYCDFSDDRCGEGEKTGTCKRRPRSCPTVYTPVCTCRSQIATNECAAYAMGQDLGADSSCMALGGYVRCGPRYCDADDQYCELRAPPPVGGAHACKTLPAACAMQKDCACFGATCSKCTYAEGFTLTCP